MMICFLRHGKTVSAGTYTGVGDPDLSEEGRQQILQVSGLIRKMEIDTCFCSPLLRCVKTLELLDITSKYMYDQQLAEIDFGLWEGLSFSEICKEDQKNMDLWVEQKEKFTFPGGDNIQEFSDGVNAWLEKLFEKNLEKVLVITHGGVIKHAVCHLLGLESKYADRFQAKEGSVSIITREHGFSYLTGFNCRG